MRLIIFFAVIGADESTPNLLKKNNQTTCYLISQISSTGARKIRDLVFFTQKLIFKPIFEPKHL
jgi:hypothetical protein